MAELIFQGGTIVTLDEQFHIVRGDLAMANGIIVHIARDEHDRYLPQTGDYEVVDARGMLIMPGLVSAHVHTCQTLARGRADTQELMPWLREVIWPYEAALDAPAMRAASALACAEMLLSGTTAMMDMASVHHTDAVFETATTAGMRASIGKALMDLPDAHTPQGLRETTAASLAEATRLIGAWHGTSDGRIKAALAPRFVLSCTDDLLRAVAALAREHGVVVHTHASENPGEVELVRARFGSSNIDCLGELGLLGTHVVLAHCVHVSQEDIARLASTGTNVAHCPASNLKLASGIANVPALLAAGVSVGIGCDGAPCNNTLDGFGEMRLAALLHRVHAGHRDPRAIAPETVLRMATLGGARCLGMADQLGTIELGKRGDVIAVATDSLTATPFANPTSFLAFSATGRDVTHVAVDGKLVVRDRRLLTLDVARVRSDAIAASQRLFAAG
ncbi:MAG: 5'-deoxyadenosine deaminase [Myxococcales bacterium]|nr:5'-deoxyadenosine deaminase [Myxococcales bacterium]